MTLFDIHPDKVPFAAIESLVSTQERESQRLEFKRLLQLQNRKERKEVAKDVAAMANGGGGIIIYGVDEQLIDGADCAAALMPLSDDLSDALDQVLSNRISPRVTYQIGWVPAHSQPGGFLLVRVLPNSQRLHCCDSVFYTRTEKGRIAMSEHDIRRRYNEIFTIQQESRSRIDKLVSDNFPTPLPSRDYFGVLLVPLLGAEDFIDLAGFDVTILDKHSRRRSCLSLTTSCYWPGGFGLDPGDPMVPAGLGAARIEVDTALQTADEVTIAFARQFMNKLAWSAGHKSARSYFDESQQPTELAKKDLLLSDSPSVPQ